VGILAMIAHFTTIWPYYDGNWIGAVQVAPINETFNSVAGQFIVPKPSSAHQGLSSASIWVGMDGYAKGARTALVQAGVTISITKVGKLSLYEYQAWYEWYPEDVMYLPVWKFSLKAGHRISLNVTALTSSTATAEIINLTTGRRHFQKFNAPSENSIFVGRTAEWIVESYMIANWQKSLVPDFGVVLFENATANAGNHTLGTNGAISVNCNSPPGTDVLLKDSNITFPSTSQVRIEYIPV
jgi:hypothetical protein